MRWLIALLAWLVASAASAGLVLEGSTDALEVVTSAAGSIDYQASWSNVTATALTTPGTTKGNITTATTTTVVAAPAASNFRHLRGLYLRNASTTATNQITVQVDVSATNRTIWQGTLGIGEALVLDESGRISLYVASGAQKLLPSEVGGTTGRSFAYSKNATAFDAIGYHYAYAKDTGFPSAWVPGTPGINGVNTDCSLATGTSPASATVMGTWQIPDPAGAWFLTNWGHVAAVIGTVQLVDALWYNTGIVVTTTTAQTITMAGALPARDLDGSTNGRGVGAALYTTTANTNAAAIANTTLSYTDQDGNAGATATFSGIVGFQAPMNPVVGTWMPFQLAAGDSGIRSVQSVTLGTSYAGGALSLVLYKPIGLTGVAVANTSSGSLGGFNPIAPNPGVRIWNDTCLWLTALAAPATNAHFLMGGVVELMDR